MSFVVGVLVGGGVMWWLARQRPQEVRLRRMHGELITRLRSDVELLYAHLQRGAANLTAEDAVQRRLRELEQDGETGRTTHSG